MKKGVFKAQKVPAGGLVYTKWEKKNHLLLNERSSIKLVHIQTNKTFGRVDYLQKKLLKKIYKKDTLRSIWIIKKSNTYQLERNY